jgi:dihydrolipoamide dehydrogenase
MKHYYDFYDLSSTSLGGGPGGYVAAIKAGQMGLKTACVEMRGRLGGTCLNVGCIPSKALLQSTHHYYDAKEHFKDHGIVIEGNITMDITKMQAVKSTTVDGLTGGIEYLLKKYKVDYYKGKGMISSMNQVTIDSLEASSSQQVIDTKNIIIATGSEVTPLPPVPVNNEGMKIVDSTGALDIASIPNSLAIIGGGVIGLEMGSVWARLGSQVTVIEFLGKLRCCSCCCCCCFSHQVICYQKTNTDFQYLILFFLSCLILRNLSWIIITSMQ